MSQQEQVKGDGLKPVRALIDVVGGRRNEKGALWDRIPPAMFGSGRPKLLRKLVLIAIAASADADGSNAFPSRETIAHRCLVTVRAVTKAIRWLKENGLLRVESKAASTGKFARTNRYTIRWPTDPADTSSVEASRLDPEVQGTAVPGTNKGQGTTVLCPSEALGTVGASTGNDAGQHQEQLKGAPGTAVPSTVPLPPVYVPPVFDREKPDSFLTSQNTATGQNEQARLTLFEHYKIWFYAEYAELSPSAAQWNALELCFLSTTCSDFVRFVLATEKIVESYDTEDRKLQPLILKALAGGLVEVVNGRIYPPDIYKQAEVAVRRQFEKDGMTYLLTDQPSEASMTAAACA